MSAAVSRRKGTDTKVGCRKPPVHTRFRKGQSGNPGGRPRGLTPGRLANLVHKEAYRLISVREGERVFTIPVIQAVLRNQLALAAKGNGPAQRAVLTAVQAIERELSATSIAAPGSETDMPNGSNRDTAKALLLVLGDSSRTAQEQDD